MFPGTSSFHPAPSTRLTTLHAQHPLTPVCPRSLRDAVPHSLHGNYTLLKVHPHSTANFSLARCLPVTPHIHPPPGLSSSGASLNHYASTLKGSSPGFIFH